MQTKRKLIITALSLVFVLLTVVAAIVIAFAMSQQTITTTLNITYRVEDIDGTARASYTIGGVTEKLTAMKGSTVLGDTLVFKAGDKENAGSLEFPENALNLTSQNDNVVIQYIYSNTGDKHYIASMSFDAELDYENMKVEYSINGVDYSTNRYAVAVPAHTENKSYWIRISIVNKAENATFKGDFNWLLIGCDDSETNEAYKSLTSVEFLGSNGSYSVSFNGEGEYLPKLVFPSEVNGDPVTTIVQNENLTETQKAVVTDVYIPDSVTTIGTSAFSDFANLQTVTFEQNETAGSASVQSGAGISTIGEYAFENCVSIKEFYLPKSVTYIRERAFDGCSFDKLIIDNINLFAQIKFGDGYFPPTSNPLGISKYLYYSNDLNNPVVDIVFDNTITEINDYAFIQYYGLNSVVISESITTIGSAVFEMSGLQQITFVNKEGWTATSGSETIQIDSSTLEDASSAAEYFTMTHLYHVWTRS